MIHEAEETFQEKSIVEESKLDHEKIMQQVNNISDEDNLEDKIDS